MQVLQPIQKQGRAGQHCGPGLVEGWLPLGLAFFAPDTLKNLEGPFLPSTAPSGREEGRQCSILAQSYAADFQISTEFGRPMPAQTQLSQILQDAQVSQ